MKAKTTRVDVAAVTHLYTVAHLTLREIAQLSGFTHAGVAKALQRAGITSKAGEHVPVRCAHCGTDRSVTRSRWRRNTRFYCNMDCKRLSMIQPDKSGCWDEILENHCRVARKNAL